MKKLDMKKRHLAIIAIAPILLAAGVYLLAQHARDIETAHHNVRVESDERAQLYTCPMHPEVVQEGPGTCPICKMDLVPMKQDRAGGASADVASRGESLSAGPSVTIDPVVVQNMGVRVAKAERTPLFRRVRTVGEIEVAEDEVSVVNLRFSGWVERIYVDETGRRVKRGEPLFAIYSPELVQAQEEYLLAVNAGGKSSRLAKSAARRLELWGISRGYLDKVAQRGQTFRSITIYAPRTGYVLHKNIVQGARVQAGSDLYRIGDLAGSIWVEAEIYEYDAPWIEEGQPATMELSFQEGRTWEGQVDYIYPTLNPKTRTLRVRLVFANPGLSLKPGMLATVRIEVGRKDEVLTVPQEAVLYSGERRIAFVSRGGGKYQPRELELGLVGDNHRVEVLSGLDVGEEVVVSGQFLLDSESRLQEAVQKLLGAGLQAGHHHD